MGGLDLDLNGSLVLVDGKWEPTNRHNTGLQTTNEWEWLVANLGHGAHVASCLRTSVGPPVGDSYAGDMGHQTRRGPPRKVECFGQGPESGG